MSLDLILGHIYESVGETFSFYMANEKRKRTSLATIRDFDKV